jgi:hypothetical protein
MIGFLAAVSQVSLYGYGSESCATKSDHVGIWKLRKSSITEAKLLTRDSLLSVKKRLRHPVFLKSDSLLLVEFLNEGRRIYAAISLSEGFQE